MKFLVIIPFIPATHHEVEANSYDDAVLKGLQQAYESGRWDYKIPRPTSLWLREAEETSSSMSWAVAKRNWAVPQRFLSELPELDADLASCLVEGWEARYRIGTVTVVGPLAT